MGGPPAWRLGEVLTTLRLKTGIVTKEMHVCRTWTDILYDLSNGKVYRFNNWNMWSLYMAGPLTAAARELARYQ